MRINPPLPSRTHASASRLRAEMTDAERKLWFRLRGGRLGGFKLRRQHPVPPYIVDFYCHDALLAVELDGSQHNEETDGMRTSSLQRQGLQVLRFWDHQVLTETEAVLEHIRRIAQSRTLTRRCAPPSPEGRGQKQNGGNK